MRGSASVLILHFLIVLIVCVSGARAQSSDYGPEVKAFLRYLHQEEIELEFQLAHREIARAEFARSKSRIAVHRAAVLKFVKEKGQDVVPDYNVVAASEAGQLVENGEKLLKAAHPGDLIGPKWRLVSSDTKGEVFYVLERVSQ